jgi:hypothetical protein
MPDLFTDEMTLAEARDQLRGLVNEGHHCPLCTQYAKVYRRNMSSSAARTLILLYRFGEDEYIELGPLLQTHAPALAGRGESTHGHWWKLMEQPPDLREDGARGNGLWRITPLGVEFVCRRRRVPKYARIYDGRCLGYRGAAVSITQCLGQRFDYRELMGAR